METLFRDRQDQHELTENGRLGLQLCPLGQYKRHDNDCHLDTPPRAKADSMEGRKKSLRNINKS